jgi:hypothetical protein
MLGFRPPARTISGAFALAVVLALGSCGPEPDDIRPRDNAVGTGGTAAGGTGGAGGSDAPFTSGELCDITGMALCKRFMGCGFGDAAGCFMRYKGGCCANENKCDETFDPSVRPAAKRCADAFAVEPCPDVMKGTVPPACM